MSIVSVNLENLSESAREEVLRSIAQAEAKAANPFHGVKDGDTFTIAGMEFIKFQSMDGGTPIVAKNYLFSSKFGVNNDLRQSPILTKLETEVLPKIAEVIGEENICTIKTDLTTLDGLKPYGTLESKISLPTLDFYRAHVDIFDRYKVDRYFWLATPESAQPHDAPNWVVCVSPSGYVGYNGCNFGYGVRPILILKSTIFDASEG